MKAFKRRLKSKKNRKIIEKNVFLSVGFFPEKKFEKDGFPDDLNVSEK